MHIIRLFIPLSLLALFISCQPQESQPVTSRVDVEAIRTSMPQQSVNDDQYWRQGKAELNRYELLQNRYRDLHPGEAVLVFVLEDFLTDKQVKNDNYRNPNSTPILKTNGLFRFPTGIYDYSLMLSVFTPFDVNQFPQTLKVTHTAQDWCGQGYLQLNRQKEGYKVSSFSYFESEGDVMTTVPVSMLEDELYNRIRLNPDQLPQGEIDLLPSSNVIRMMHLPFKAFKARVEKKSYVGEEFEGDNQQVLIVNYPDLNRQLEIVYSGNAPYEILGWKDTYPSAFDRRPRTTIAKRTHKLLSPYWSKNALADQDLRAKLGLVNFLP
ncbi:MAG: hypothetical protein AAFW00_03415 [Bacteroidota bacterium]